jgi:hypothetical protein
MKKVIIIILFIAGGLPCYAQSFEVQQLLLNVEKLNQFRQILKDMKEGYQMINKGYETVKDISEGNFSLHKTFLDGLLQISPTVRKYQRVELIVDLQLRIIRDCRRTTERFRNSNNFSNAELTYTGKVYERLRQQSLRNMDDLLAVMTAGELRMSDDERLKEIDRIYFDLQEKSAFLSSFIQEQGIISLQRERNLKDNLQMQRNYGLLP